MPHTPFIGPDGKDWPSVTEICDVIAKPALYRFYADNGWDGAERIKKESGSIGSEFHDGIFQRFNGAVEVYTTPAPELMVNKFFDEFVKPYKVVPIALEQKVINHTKRYHGSFDGIIRVTNMPVEIRYGIPSTTLYSGEVLADWKSSNGIYDSHGIQLGGYRKASPTIPNSGLIVQVKRDTLKLKHKFFFDLDYYGEVFYNAREIYDYLHKQGAWDAKS